MTCRKVVCQECATTFEGQNQCRPCLLKREAARKKGEGPLVSAGLLAVGLVLSVAAAYAMAWGGALMARHW